MKYVLPITAIMLGTMTCGPETEQAQADRRHDSGRPDAEPSASPAARAWKASYVAEAAGQFQAAVQALTALPSPQRDGYLASFRRGWLLYRLNQHTESVAAYKLAAMAEPASIEARLGLLLPLMALTRWNDVAVLAEDVLKRDPENYLALQRLAFAKFSSEHFPEAEVVYRRLVEHYPSDVEMRAALGWVCFRMGKQQEATTLFKQVLELASEHVSATAGLRAATANRKKVKF
ncbi:MAG TPA: tetratricopeptide repeat protein [Polyangiales bacterium]|nr:tetratricopeptide repeat protein [Polyangiales bacterium]